MTNFENYIMLVFTFEDYPLLDRNTSKRLPQLQN